MTEMTFWDFQGKVKKILSNYMSLFEYSVLDVL